VRRLRLGKVPPSLIVLAIGTEPTMTANEMVHSQKISFGHDYDMESALHFDESIPDAKCGLQ